jgi:hypothetical protein
MKDNMHTLKVLKRKSVTLIRFEHQGVGFTPRVKRLLER